MRAGGSSYVMLLALAACDVGALIPGDAPVAIDARADAPGPGLAIAPSQHDFGTVLANATSAHVAVVVSTGSPTGPLSVSVSGSAPEAFVVVGGNCDGAILTPQTTCTEWVTFRPSSPGSKSAALTVTGAPGGSAMTQLLGTSPSGSATFAIAPQAAHFGDAVIGQPTAMQRFTISNPGVANIGPLVTVKAGNHPAEFEIVTDACNGQIVGPTASCTIDVRFHPTALGAKSASIVIAGPGGTVTGSLDGTGIVSPVALAMTPTLHDFGTVPYGATSPPFTFTATNTGSAPTAALTTSSSDPAFAIVASTDTCIGTALAPGASCTLQVRFSSTTSGTHAAALEVTDGTTSVTAALAGLTAGTDYNTLSPPSPYAFPDVVVGNSSAPQLFTLTNGPWATHAGGTVAVAGTDASQFLVTTDGCTGATIAPSASCTFSVVFTPASPGQKSAAVNVWFTPGVPTFVALHGTGVTP